MTTDAQREQHIAACDRHAATCALAGDDEYARNWNAARRAAVAERDQGCFFAISGHAARLAAQEKAA